MGYVRLYGSGEAVDLENPKWKVQDVDIQGLKNINRFVGAGYSVAMHSVICVNLAMSSMDRLTGNELAYVFVHDFHEAVTGDIVSPLKKHTQGSGLGLLEVQLDRCVYSKYKLQAPSAGLLGLVRKYDYLALRMEAYILNAEASDKDFPEITVDEQTIIMEARSAGRAKRDLHLEFDRLLKLINNPARRAITPNWSLK